MTNFIDKTKIPPSPLPQLVIVQIQHNKQVAKIYMLNLNGRVV
jgi:hypothetical protein